MNTNYFGKRKLLRYFSNNELPSVNENRSSIGICSITEIIEILEIFKVRNLLISEMEMELEKIKYLSDQGYIYISCLTPEKICFLLEDEEFWMNYTSKRLNPFKIMKYCELSPLDTDFWGVEILTDSDIL